MIRQLPTLKIHSVILAIILGIASAAQAETTSGTLVVGPGETLVIGSGAERHHNGAIIVSGGRIEVTGGKLFLNGSMMILQGGAVVFDAGEFHHEGNNTHVLVGGPGSEGGDGLLAFRNGGRYRFAQTYVSQHELHARNNSRIELDGTKISADAGTMAVKLFDNATYSATAAETAAGSWLTWYMYQRSRLTLQGVRNAGDIVFYDEAQIDVRNSIGIMPWLYFPDGSVADLSFPDASHCDDSDCPLVSKTIDSSTVRGIDWSVRIENSALVLWGVHSYPGSSVTVRDSALAMALVRLAGDQEYFVAGEFRNDSAYEDKTFTSLPDRLLRMTDTSVKWWKVDVIEGAAARIHNITFAEMMVKDSALAFLTNSICEGQTIHLGATHDAFLYFKDGEVWTFVSAWNRAVMVLDGSLVDWTKGQFQYQTRNIAHDRSRLYAVNSKLLAAPEAMDSALVTFAALGAFEQAQLETERSTWTPITGSAWIVPGPDSRVRFNRWVLAIRTPGQIAWTDFATGTNEVRETGFAWLPPWLISRSGNYEVRLTLFVHGDEPGTRYPAWAFPAVKRLVVR